MASKWGSNCLKVLISTTLGLVGNESINTQHVCVAGILYDLLSIVQAMGRIQLIRRSNDSQMCIYIPSEVNIILDLGSIKSMNHFIQLKTNKIIDVNCEECHKQCMTVSSVYEWMTTDLGCWVLKSQKKTTYIITTG